VIKQVTNYGNNTASPDYSVVQSVTALYMQSNSSSLACQTPSYSWFTIPCK